MCNDRDALNHGACSLVSSCPVSQIHNCCSVAEASSHGLLIQLDDHGSQVAMEDNLVSAARKLGVIAGYETFFVDARAVVVWASGAG